MSRRRDKTGILLKAISYASREHQGQFRKDKITPYASHPFRVCMILRHVFKVSDEEVLAAAVLHDTIEDTTTDRDDLIEHFGGRVAGWVSLLSKDKRMEGPACEADYMKKLKSSPLAVRLIKLADVYDNLTDAATVPSEAGRKEAIMKASRYLAVLKIKNGEINKLLREIKCFSAQG